MAQRVNDETFVFYEQARSLALDSSHFNFESVSQTLTFMVFQLRYNLSKAELEALDGKGTFLWSVDSGLVNNKTLAAFDIDQLKVEGGTAVASVLHNGQSVPGLSMEFSKQNEIWAFNLIDFGKGGEAGFKEMRDQLFKGKVGLAIFMMERTYGKKIPAEILSGPLK